MRRFLHRGLGLSAVGLAFSLLPWTSGQPHANAARPSTNPVRVTASFSTNGSKPTAVLTSMVERPLASTPGGLPVDCVPNGAGPPISPYQLGFVAEVGPGSLTAGPVAVDNITAKVCGVATVVNGSGGCAVTASVNVPPDGQKFGPLAATITEIPGIRPSIPFTVDPAELDTSLGCGASNNGLQVTAVAKGIGGHAGLFGLSCGITLTITLNTTITGAIDSGLDLHGTLASNSFGIPAALPAPPFCPAGVTKALNQIVGLPLAPGKAVLSLPFHAAVWVPPAP